MLEDFTLAAVPDALVSLLISPGLYRSRLSINVRLVAQTARME
jgi:hypothetical protein